MKETKLLLQFVYYLGCRLPLALTFFPNYVLFSCWDVFFLALLTWCSLLPNLFNQVLSYWNHILLFLLSVLVTSDGTYLLILWCGKIYIILFYVIYHCCLDVLSVTVGRNSHMSASVWNLLTTLWCTCSWIPLYLSTGVEGIIFLWDEQYWFNCVNSKHSSLPVLPSLFFCPLVSWSVPLLLDDGQYFTPSPKKENIFAIFFIT